MQTKICCKMLNFYITYAIFYNKIFYTYKYLEFNFMKIQTDYICKNFNLTKNCTIAATKQNK